MKSIFPIALILVALSLSPLFLHAQTPAPATPSDQESPHGRVLEKMCPYLTADQRAEFQKALFPALEKDSSLETDGIALMQAGKAAHNGTQADKDAFHKQMADYEARLRKAMTAEDAGVSAIFDQIEAHTPALHAST